MAITVRTFVDSDLEQAAALLSAFGERWALEDPPLAGLDLAALTAERERARSAGLVAERDGRMVAYLLAAPIDEPPWRRSTWTGLGGWALAPGEPATTVQDLYAEAAADWVADGRFEHVVFTPAAEAWTPWFELGFGAEQVHALRRTDALDATAPPGVEVRRATPEDHALVLPLVDVVARQLSSSPCFAPSTREWRADFPEGHADLLADSEVRYWVAVEGARVLSFAVLSDATARAGIPDRCAYLDLAATLPEARRRGLVRAQLAAGLDEARAAGQVWCATDWRSASLGTARSWTALGFAPTYLRLRRRVDERIAWARL